MKGLAIAPIAVIAVMTAYALSSGARAEPADETETPTLVCEVGGMTPGRARQARASRLQLVWNPADEAELVRAGDNLELKLKGAGGVLRGERAYALTGVELRPRANSRRYPAEARFIHQNAVGDRVVVGVYLTEGEANPAMETLKAAVDGADSAALDGLDPRRLLPRTDARLVFADRTPPSCAPRVIWTVVDAPVEASREQLAALLPFTPGMRADAAD